MSWHFRAPLWVRRNICISWNWISTLAKNTDTRWTWIFLWRSKVVKHLSPPTQVPTHPTIWSSILSPGSPPSASTSSSEMCLKIKCEAKHLSGRPPWKQELSVSVNTRGAGRKKSRRCLLRRRYLNAIKPLFLRKNTVLAIESYFAHTLILWCQFEALMGLSMKSPFKNFHFGSTIKISIGCWHFRFKVVITLISHCKNFINSKSYNFNSPKIGNQKQLMMKDAL